MVTRPLIFIKAGYFVMGVPKPWGPRLTGHYGAGQGGKIMGLWLCPMTLLKFNEGISVG